MIEYVIANNPDDRVLKKASDLLNQGEIICFPTDTSWVVSVDPFVRGALEKLHKLKGEEKSKHFSLLCNDFSTASEVAIVTDSAFKLLRNQIPGHYTFIFEASKTLTKAIKASKTDKEVGLRFVPSELISRLIEVHGKVLATTNLTPELLGIKAHEEVFSYQIEEKLAHQLSMIIDPGEYNFVGESTIYKFIRDEVELIREGSGKLIF